VTFFEGAFYYHAWNEVCLDDNWYSVDTTKNQFPADLSHIKFVEGETNEQVRIAALLGKLKIEIVEDKRN
jgi:transglutaminase-like putative cysteine protease